MKQVKTVILSIFASIVASISISAFAEPSKENCPYYPTELESELDVQALFNSLYEGMNTSSQSYQRAYIWSYQMKLESKIDSMHAFVFFTKPFRMKNGNNKWGKPFSWWFHSAPMIYVKTPDGTLKKMILDKVFFDQAVELDTWTKKFTKTQSNPDPKKCVEIPLYSEQVYEKAGEQADCLVRIEPMYVQQPKDAELSDNGGEQITGFTKDRLNVAKRALCSGKDFLNCLADHEFELLSERWKK